VKCTCLTKPLEKCEATKHECNCPHDYLWPSNGHNIYCPASDEYVGRDRQKNPPFRRTE
jgi:hypothetical protein